MFLIGRKILNRRKRAINGNGQDLKIEHWNGGSKLWQNKKDELELLLSQRKPDLCFISESNLWAGLASHKMEIQGHSLIFPKSLKVSKLARIMLIVKENGRS